MLIIALQSGKGGSGKTTLSIHLSQGFANQGYKVLLVDSDPQGSVMDWVENRSKELNFSVVAFNRPTLHRDIGKIAKDYDFVFIDGAPRSTDIAKSAIAAADLVLIPVKPSPLDVWAAADTVNLINEVSLYKQVEAAFVINQKVVNASITKSVIEALSQYSYPVLYHQISQRIAFPEVIAQGATVLDFKNQAIWAARQEIIALVGELLDNINNQES